MAELFAVIAIIYAFVLAGLLILNEKTEAVLIITSFLRYMIIVLVTMWVLSEAGLL